jgi:tetratricopeptide (TPR) repeat protein
MPKEKQNEKTVILPDMHEHMQETTASVHEPHQRIPEGLDRKKRKRSLLRLVLLAAVVLSSAVLGGYAVYEHREQGALTEKLTDAVRQDKLRQAQEIMREIRKHGYTSVSLTVLEKQLITMKALSDAWDRVQHYYNLGMYREARNAVAAFTSNTAYRDRAGVLLEDMRTKELNTMLKSAGLLYAQGNRDKATILIHQVLELDPSNRDAQALLAMVKPVVSGLKENRRRVNSSTVKKKDPVKNTGDTAYKKGDFSTAVRLWSTTHKKDDAKKIVLSSNIKKYISIGQKAFESGDYPLAIKSFEKVQTFVSVLGIHGSVNEYTFRKYLSLSFGLQGKQALADGQQKRANVCFQESLKYDPSNAEAARGVSVLNEEAEKLYKTAYMISSANTPEACRLYKQALDITQKDADVYKKVKEHLIICKP